MHFCLYSLLDSIYGIESIFIAMTLRVFKGIETNLLELQNRASSYFTIAEHTRCSLRITAKPWELWKQATVSLANCKQPCACA